jgi:hypothetical protein
VVRSNRIAGIAALGVMAVLGGCDDLLVQGPPADLGNVEFTLGGGVEQTDTAVVVGGRTVVRHPSIDRSLWLDRFERFTHGGFPELGYEQAERYSLSWRLQLTHGHPPEERGDSTILWYVDHGQAAVAHGSLDGVVMDRLTDLPHVSPGTPMRFENFVRYHSVSYTHVDWQNGGSTTFVNAPYHAGLVAGASLTVSTTGSEEAEPAAGSFAVRPFAALTGLENGVTLDLAGSMPVIDTEEPLVFVFDRPLDPERSYIFIVPFAGHPELLSAFVQPQWPSGRVVLLPHVLRQLMPAAGAGPVAFRAFVVEIHVQEDVFAGSLAGHHPDDSDRAEFSLPFVQRGETTVHFYLRR